ncbi:MAG: glutamate--tRNA ligase [Inquilinus sp.]|nr:glutamate--tRNA ligase [Inquilinus sp.]
MSVVTRFAPSPTGLLHVGNARTALIAWLFARHAGGRFLLRLDDTDTERCRPEFAAAIERDLAWLGIDWDGFARQSERTALYAAAIERLKRQGRLYPCYETPEELALKRKSLLSRGRPPIYDRAALALGDAERADLEAKGLRPHWRFRLDHAAIEWEDLVRGAVRFDGADLSDPVLIRADGTALYHIGSVVDDIELGISHIVRGEDHVANTAAHVQLFEALDARPPRFAHLPLLADAVGKGLSKRLGSLSLQALREEEGLEPMAVVSLLARLGTADPVEPFAGMTPLIAGFDFGKFARGTPKFDPADLGRLNARILHGTDYDNVAGRLAALGLEAADRPFWEAVRPNLARFDAVRDWWEIVHGTIEPAAGDPAFLAEAVSVLPPEPWDGTTFAAWTAALKQATGRKGRELFQPLRLALTGRDHGPEMKLLLPLIGRRTVLARLSGREA